MKNIDYRYVEKIYSIIYILRLIITGILIFIYFALELVVLLPMIFFWLGAKLARDIVAFSVCGMIYIGFLIKWSCVIKVPYKLACLLYISPLGLLIFNIIFRALFFITD